MNSDSATPTERNESKNKVLSDFLNDKPSRPLKEFADEWVMNRKKKFLTRRVNLYI